VSFLFLAHHAVCLWRSPRRWPRGRVDLLEITRLLPIFLGKMTIFDKTESLSTRTREHSTKIYQSLHWALHLLHRCSYWVAGEAQFLSWITCVCVCPLTHTQEHSNWNIAAYSRQVCVCVCVCVCMCVCVCVSLKSHTMVLPIAAYIESLERHSLCIDRRRLKGCLKLQIVLFKRASCIQQSLGTL